MPQVARWILGGLVGVLGLVGLIMAANAHDQGIYYAGLGLSACATLYIFFMIKQAYDRADRRGESS